VINQLSPCSINILLLIIIHPIILLHKLVRSIYLMMTGSHGFGSNKYNFFLLIWFFILLSYLLTCWSLMQKVFDLVLFFPLIFWILCFRLFSLPSFGFFLQLSLSVLFTITFLFFLVLVFPFSLFTFSPVTLLLLSFTFLFRSLLL